MEIFSIIGPIGAGKSTFVESIKPYNLFNYYYHEDVKGNPYLKLPPTVENQIKCQEYIIQHKIDFYQQFANQDLSQVKILEDASLYQDLFYVYLNMYYQDRDSFDFIFKQYEHLIDTVYGNCDKHTIIFIDLDSKQNLANVKKRGRDFEQDLDLEFFIKQKEVLLKILSHFEDRFTIINYQPSTHMFEDDDVALSDKYHHVFKNLGLI